MTVANPSLFKLLLGAVSLNWLLASALFAQSAVTLTVETDSPRYAIPEDFAGISFETAAELPNQSGVSGYLFSPANTQLITLFTNTGIRNLRLGGGTVDDPRVPIPTRRDLDSVFGFAKAARLKVIYSFRLLNGNPEDAAATAKYIWTRYRPLLDCFSNGNEPNGRAYSSARVGAISNYREYLSAWRKFAAAVTRAAPGAKFAAPEAVGHGWVGNFARDEKNSGRIALITQHQYPGWHPYVGRQRKQISPAKAINTMLSRNWVTKIYPAFYKQTLAFAQAEGLADRMTEANDYLHGVTNASNAFASALWTLDYMHWWAAHGCAGINFHNNQHREWLKTDTFYLDPATGDYRINPKAYAIRAFNLGSRGRVEPVVIGNADDLNLTAYAVGNSASFCVTIINKEHGRRGRDAVVTIMPAGHSVKRARVMFLTAPDGNPGATKGVTLGRARITNNAPWHGQWTPLHPTANHSCKVVVPATSAAVVSVWVE